MVATFSRGVHCSAIRHFGTMTDKLVSYEICNGCDFARVIRIRVGGGFVVRCTFDEDICHYFGEDFNFARDEMSRRCGVIS